MLNFAPRPRSTMDSMRASEAPDPGSIPGEATKKPNLTMGFFCLNTPHLAFFCDAGLSQFATNYHSISC